MSSLPSLGEEDALTGNGVIFVALGFGSVLGTEVFCMFKIK
jgi:hypothetical protein